MPAGFKNSRKLWTNGQDPNIPVRLLNLENNEYKVTYYEIISGASGSLTLPGGATINAGEFGLSGNCILSKIDGSNKPTFESPKTSGGTIVTASLNVSTGAWVASGAYTDSNVALIYSIKIKAVNYSNLDYDFIIETLKLDNYSEQLAVLTSTSISTTANTNTDLTEMTTTLLPNTTYTIDGVIRVGCNNTGGVAVQVNIPSGSVFIGMHGFTTSSTVVQYTQIAADATLSGAYCRLNTSVGQVHVKGTIEVGVTGGDLVWGFASVTNTQTSTVYRLGTQIKITKV